MEAFRNGDFALFRLTPDKYHYNHCPVAGEVVDIYQIDGAFNSCNPGAIVTVATPYGGTAMECPKCKAKVGIMKHLVQVNTGTIDCIKCFICGYWVQIYPGKG